MTWRVFCFGPCWLELAEGQRGHDSYFVKESGPKESGSGVIFRELDRAGPNRLWSPARALMHPLFSAPVSVLPAAQFPGSADRREGG